MPSLLQPTVSRRAFPFLELPPELRTKIYHLAILGDDDRIQPTTGILKARHIDANTPDILEPLADSDSEDYSPISRSSSPTSRRTNLDILLVCKQILHEAECIWYAETRFVLSYPMQAMQFFATLGEKRRIAVTRVELSCVDGYRLAESVSRFWLYLERMRTLSNPTWIVVGVSGDDNFDIEELIQLLVESLPPWVQDVLGRAQRCGLLHQGGGWSTGGTFTTSVVPWLHQADSSETFLERLKAIGFFDNAVEE
jgi:hypothetical protein